MEHAIGALTYLASGGWIDEYTLTRRFGEDTIQVLYKAGAIKKRWKENGVYSSYQYAITTDGEELLKSGVSEDLREKN